jgi:hypothetical protein
MYLIFATRGNPLAFMIAFVIWVGSGKVSDWLMFRPQDKNKNKKIGKLYNGQEQQS